MSGKSCKAESRKSDFLQGRCICYTGCCCGYLHCVNNNRWRRGVVVNTLITINEVTLCQARLVFGWVTDCGQVKHLGM